MNIKAGCGKWREIGLRWAELRYIVHRTQEEYSEEELHNAQEFL